MSSILILIGTWFFFSFQYTNAYKIDCSATSTSCENSFINCLTNEDCFILCVGAHSCSDAIINCPMYGDCNIECSGQHACEDITIDATLSNGNLNVLCASNDINSIEECTGMKVFGTTRMLLKSNSSSNFDIQCTGNLASCIHSQIICPINSNCSILCSTKESCKSSIITGPLNGDLNIYCHGDISCYDSIFNAVESNSININGCKTSKSCLNLQIYCPPNTNGYKNCNIQGNDNLGKDKSLTIEHAATQPTNSPTIKPTHKPSNSPIYDPSDGIIIYAINGWDDINIDYTGEYGAQHEGKIYCGYMYDKSCNLASNAWKCNHENHLCNNYNIQSVINPTIAPTTTNTPTKVIFDIITNNENNNNSGVNKYFTTGNKNGDFFILIGVGIILITCCAVGYAQIRKNIMDAKRLSQVYNNKGDGDRKMSSFHDSKKSKSFFKNDKKQRERLNRKLSCSTPSKSCQKIEEIII